MQTEGGELKIAINTSTYIECSWDDVNKQVVRTAMTRPTPPTSVTSSTYSLDNDWYVVSGNVTINRNVLCSGHARLILCDGANLTITGGLTVRNHYSRDSLTIYCQSYSSSMGRLTCTSGAEFFSGIGGDETSSAKTPTATSPYTTATFAPQAVPTGPASAV